jgi:hypothetical protein
MTRPTQDLGPRPALCIVAATIALLLAGCPASLGAPGASQSPTKTNVPPTATPVELLRREGPLITPTYCSSDRPTFWPTGVPPPTRGPAAVKRAIPADKETCLQMGGFWDIPFCSGQMRPTDAPPPAQSCWEVPTADPCRPCSDGTECEGWCSVPTGGQEPPMTGMCSPIARQWQWKRAAILNGQVVEQIRECE